MGLGDFLVSMDNVGRGYDEAGQRQRQYRDAQLAIQERNRLEAQRIKDMRDAQQAARAPLAPPPQVGQYDIGSVPTLPVLPVPGEQAPAMPVAGQPTAPSTPGAAAPTTAAPTTAAPTTSEVARFQSLGPAERMAELKRINNERLAAQDRAAVAVPLGSLADTVTFPARTGLGVLEAGANAIGIPRLGRALGIYDPDVTRVEVPGAIRDKKTLMPLYDAAQAAVASNDPLDEAGYLKLLKEKDAKAPKAAPQAAPQTGTPTKRGAQYDAAKTPFEPLITQAATQYNVDPTVFKRLIGSESSFQAAPKPPTDSKGPIAFGIAQIHRMHIQSGAITMEQALDPATALPFAAKLFAGYLEKAGGDYNRALQMYKGASSDKGKAAMTGPINDVLAGTPYAVAPAEIKAQTQSPVMSLVSSTPEKPGLSERRKMKPSDFYLGGSESGQDRISMDGQMMQAEYQANREMLMRQYQRIAVSGDAGAINQVEAQIRQLDSGYTNGMRLLKGMDAIRKFENFNDPRYLSAMISEMSPGNNYQFQPYEDGDYEVVVINANGQQSRKGKYSVAEVISFAKDFYDQAYRQSKIDAKKASAVAQAENAGKLAIEEVKGLFDLRKAVITGNVELQKQILQGMQADVKTDTNGNVVMFRKDGSQAGFITPGGVVKDSEGREIKTPGAYTRVTGL